MVRALTIVLTLIVLALLIVSNACWAKNVYVIDGDGATYLGEWSGTRFDTQNDVVPTQVDDIDIRGVRYDRDYFRSSEQSDLEAQEGFVVLLFFESSTFAGSEERTLEIFFDTVAKAGDPNTAWKDTPYYIQMKDFIIPFHPDKRVTISWKEEKILKLSFEVWNGSIWEVEHTGLSIPEVEAAIGRRFEIGVRWDYIAPERYTDGDEDYLPFAYTLATTQGEAHDYYPDIGDLWRSDYAWDFTIVAPSITWGWLKGQMGHPKAK